MQAPTWSMSWESKDGVIRMDKASDLTPLLEGLERPYGLVITVSLTGDMLQNEGMKTRKHATNIVESMKAAIKKYRSVFSKEAEELFFISLSASGCSLTTGFDNLFASFKHNSLMIISACLVSASYSNPWLPHRTILPRIVTRPVRAAPDWP